MRRVRNHAGWLVQAAFNAVAMFLEVAVYVSAARYRGIITHVGEWRAQIYVSHESL